MKANTSLWSKENKQSFAADYVTEYTDKKYDCYRCKIKSVFTAAEQKYTYEVKKAYYWQQRILCQQCWKQKHIITNRIDDCEGQWAESKNTLNHDRQFLETWLNLLVEKEEYVSKNPNTSQKIMLMKLLGENS